jgi:hypothetical protein
MSSSNAPTWLAAGVLLLGAPFARAAVDLAAIVVVPQRAQSAGQARATATNATTGPSIKPASCRSRQARR